MKKVIAVLLCLVLTAGCKKLVKKETKKQALGIDTLKTVIYTYE
ncbi:hypothetical protein [Candidatus Endomicrobiellum agilis]|jgi:hypothetical protein